MSPGFRWLALASSGKWVVAFAPMTIIVQGVKCALSRKKKAWKWTLTKLSILRPNIKDVPLPLRLLLPDFPTKWILAWRSWSSALLIWMMMRMTTSLTTKRRRPSVHNCRWWWCWRGPSQSCNTRHWRCSRWHWWGRRREPTERGKQHPGFVSAFVPWVVASALRQKLQAFWVVCKWKLWA